MVGANDYAKIGLAAPDSCFADIDESLSQNNQTYYPVDWRYVNKTALLYNGCLDTITNVNLNHYRFKKWCHIGLFVAEVG